MLKIKLMNFLKQEAVIDLPEEGLQFVDVALISGDEILEAYYTSEIKKYDVAELLGLTRSVDSFEWKHILYMKGYIDNFNRFNQRVSVDDVWWDEPLQMY